MSFKKPETIVYELLNLISEDRIRLEKSLTALSYCGLEEDELKSEIVVRVLDGKRKCPSDVPTIAFLIQAARSIADEFYERYVVKVEKFVSIDSECELPDTNILNPEEALIKWENEEDLAKYLREIFANDEEALNYIGKRFEGETKSEIMASMKLNDNQFEAIRRRVARKIKPSNRGNQTEGVHYDHAKTRQQNQTGAL